MSEPRLAVADPAALPIRAVNSEPAEVGLRVTVTALAAIMRRITRRDWRDRKKVPRTGPAIFVVNHISNIDPLVYGHYIAWAGRWPRFLAKASIFRTPVVGWVARACGQIKVDRDRADGGGAMAEAAAALAAGGSVSIYPEGTITFDPDGWPMNGRTGAARLALETGAPLIPVAQWGAQDILGGKKLTFPRFFPPRTVHVITGDPVDIDDLRGEPPTAGTLLLITDRIMDSLTALVGDLRQELPPRGRWDPRLRRRVVRRHREER
ncbi:lysophospholipid acyltransferase family protein [Naumannella halotolerans]|uniref:1-acyl-sn-glycerol-3-phosphate acyltransferase n=1 Tax=Naumannella halotolerans TaxID=993414 RepID=A0A4V3ENB8_9ACTN|nr:lysophospholipid acyltransferase family protein [Naumannella halotolerans]TDT33168.1 1-acyl-sn-glycerol-3-phosphate acyltransferase [Naumannella halotolerans]